MHPYRGIAIAIVSCEALLRLLAPARQAETLSLFPQAGEGANCPMPDVWMPMPAGCMLSPWGTWIQVNKQSAVQRLLYQSGGKLMFPPPNSIASMKRGMLVALPICSVSPHFAYL